MIGQYDLIKVRWQILQEEGRTIKAIVDLSKLPSTFTPKNVFASHSSQTQKQEILNSLTDLKNLAKKRIEIQRFFGHNQQLKAQINSLLRVYEQNIKSQLRLPIIQFYKSNTIPLPQEFVKQKLNAMNEALQVIQSILSQKTSKFICGQTITIIDLLFFFHILNLVYFGKNHSNYPFISSWFTNVYKIREVKNITHQWFSMAKQISRSLRRRRPQPQPQL